MQKNAFLIRFIGETQPKGSTTYDRTGKNYVFAGY